MLESVLFPIVSKINEYLSNYILIFLLVGVGLWYSIKTRFVQVRCFGEGMKKFFGEMNLRGGAQKSGMTSFQALATAIAAQVGTGNIVGASGAILTGGPGAIFWMWIIAFFGMATIYAEATLAQKTRIVEPDGNIKGGPVYYITTAFKGGFGKFLAGFFAVSIILALGFMGCMVQSNSIGSTMQTAFGIPSWIVGIVLVIICAIIFLGGVQRLAAVTEKLVPIMAGIFLLGGLVILCARIKYVPSTFGMIFKYAFTPQAVTGGVLGNVVASMMAAMQYGIARGCFSNEAGMGSAAITAAAATTDHPVRQAYINMTGTFWDTIVVCSITGLCIASSGMRGQIDPATGSLYTGSALTIAAFKTVLGPLGGWLVTIGIALFAFSTILGWEYHGEKAFEYLLNTHKLNIIYRLVFSCVVFFGATMQLDLVWKLSDIANALMAIPNLICMLLLSGEIAKDIQEFQSEIHSC